MTLAAAAKLKAAMIPAAIMNAAQHQRDIAMGYYEQGMAKEEHAEVQTKHYRYLRFLREAEEYFTLYRRHIRIADKLVRT